MGLKYLKEQEVFEERCTEFLSALHRLEGPMKDVANEIADNWREEAREKLGIDFHIDL